MSTRASRPRARRRRRRPGGPVARLRPWLVPLVAVIVALFLYRGGFDPASLREELAAGDVDAALERLAAAHPDELPPELSGLDWWPAEQREARLAELWRRPEEDLLESDVLPTIVAPLGRWRDPPAGWALREAADRPLVMRLANVALDMVAATVQVPAGTRDLDPAVRLIPGTTYTLTLHDGEDGPVVAFAGFELLSPREADAVGRSMKTAYDLAPDDEAGNLLAAIVALDLGLTGEAIERLRPLSGLIAYQGVADPLIAIALDDQGLDRSAREWLRP